MMEKLKAIKAQENKKKDYAFINKDGKREIATEYVKSYHIVREWSAHELRLKEMEKEVKQLEAVIAKQAAAIS